MNWTMVLEKNCVKGCINRNIFSVKLLLVSVFGIGTNFCAKISTKTDRLSTLKLIISRC